MKLVFAVDGKVIYDKLGNKYARSFKGLYEKYKYLSDDINFLVRTELQNGNITDTPLPTEINVIDVPNFKSIKSYGSKRKASGIIKRKIKEADIVILRMPGSLANIAVKYVTEFNKPYIIECVGCPWDAYRNHSFLGKLIAPFEYFKMKENIRKATHVTYVTKEFLQNRYPTKGISCGVSDVELVEMNESILERRLEKINTVKEFYIIGTAGTVEIPYKGQEYVIKALAKLKKEGCNRFKYVLVGNGDKSRLLSLAQKLGVSDIVEFKGGIPHEEMFSWLDGIDIYIQPSTVEGLPRSVIEAMSRACPVVGSRVGGIPELVDKKYLFDKKNILQLANILKKLDSNELERMAKISFKMAKEYERESLENRRRQFYDSFISTIEGENNE